MEEKVSLPTKTKIAAWWMKFFGLGLIFLSLGSIGFYALLFSGIKEGRIWVFLFAIYVGIPVILGGCISYFLGFRLLKRRKYAWWISVTIFSIGIVFCMGGFIYYYLQEELFEEGFFAARSYYPIYFLNLVIFILLVVPLILLLLDRKNFWKVAK